ncbi:hypothetical protein DRH29_03045 [candidate division Kazan bacterium]|uniref:Uncharacterized protein n=1 Tax=candidate division Kazan bacterium TaxID=2202143 RepID=A0A420ZCP4_UNCK3|nr:MAG: hypothetical protein DRH29_03045 [candidate division Kazan bacterium]
MIDEDVKKELVQSLAEVLTDLSFNGKSYTIKSRRQNQAVRIAYPSVLIAFLESVPDRGFLGHRIGTYTSEDGSKIPLRGWIEKQRVRIEVRAKDNPSDGYMQGEPLVHFISNKIRDYILTNWDVKILGSRGMSLDEPLGGIRYISERTGSEYGHMSAFDLKITYNFYWPRYTSPSENVKIEIFEIGLKEVGDESPPTYFVLPNE